MPTAQTPSIFFEPTEQEATALVHDLCSCKHSPIDLAAKHNTTLEALTLWISRPEIQQRLATLENAACEHTRLAATFQLNSCITALSKLIEEFNHAPPLFKKREPGDPPPVRPTDQQITQHLRTNDQVVKAVASLWRLSRFTAVPRNRPRPVQFAGQSRGAQAPGVHRPSPFDPHLGRSVAVSPSQPAHHNPALTGDPEIDALIQELQSIAHQRTDPASCPANASNPDDPASEAHPGRAPAPSTADVDSLESTPAQPLRSEISDLQSPPSPPRHTHSHHPHPASTSDAWP